MLSNRLRPVLLQWGVPLGAAWLVLGGGAPAEGRELNAGCGLNAWALPVCWTPAGFPLPGEVVEFSASGTFALPPGAVAGRIRNDTGGTVFLVGGDLTLTDSGQSITQSMAGTLRLDTDLTFSSPSPKYIQAIGGALILEGSLQGTGLMRDTGSSGTLTLAADASGYTDDYLFLTADVNIGASDSIGASSRLTVISPATVTLVDFENIGSLAGSGQININHALGVGEDDTSSTYSGIRTGSATLTKLGTGVFTLTSDGALHTGDIDVDAGTLVLSTGDNVSSNSTVTVAAGAALEVTDPEGIGALAGSGDVTLTAALAVGENDASTVYTGSLLGSQQLEKVGTGTLILAGDNSGFSGPMLVSDGVLDLAGFEPVGPATIVTVDAGATLRASGPILFFAGVQGSGDLVLDGVIWVGADGTSTTFSGTVSGPASITLQGTGGLTLTGDNSYGGGTAVDASSTLIVNASSGSATSYGPVQVLTPTATLAGAGNMDGTVIVHGYLMPGIDPAGSIGTLSTSGDLSLSSTATTVLEVVDALSHDEMIVTGTANLDGALSVGSPSLLPGQSADILVAETISGTFASDDVSAPSRCSTSRTRSEPSTSCA